MVCYILPSQGARRVFGGGASARVWPCAPHDAGVSMARIGRIDGEMPHTGITLLDENGKREPHHGGGGGKARRRKPTYLLQVGDAQCVVSLGHVTRKPAGVGLSNRKWATAWKYG